MCQAGRVSGISERQLRLYGASSPAETVLEAIRKVWSIRFSGFARRA